MKLIDTPIPGVYLLENFVSQDKRGAFIKTFHTGQFAEAGLCREFKESYYSVSSSGVIRGMHFQTPPHDHEKLVHVPRGRILDVVLDLRKNSSAFCRFAGFELSENNHYSLYLPRGIAHGFCALEDNTITQYSVSTVYHQPSDAGILWNSFGFDWKQNNPLLSDRDAGFPTLQEFLTHNPFCEEI